MNTKSHTSIVILGISLAISGGLPMAKADLYPHSYALVVGINEYRDPKWPDLKHAVKDAKGMETFLKGEGFTVAALYDEQATRIAIIEHFEEVLAPKLEEGDRVLIFYAGHGYTRSLGGTDHGYIIPYDGGEKSSSYISMAEIRDKSTKMGTATHQLFIMDSCYGGQLVRAPGPGSLILDKSSFGDTPSYIKALSSRFSRQILTAGGKDEVVRDGGPGGHSYFTYHLLEALQKGLGDLNQDGWITFAELIGYLQPRASAWNQTPGYGTLPGHALGSMVFKSPYGEEIALDNDSQASILLADRLAARALREMEGGLDLSLLLGIQAVRTSTTGEALRALWETLEMNHRIAKFHHVKSAGVTSLAFSSDGTYLASGSADGGVIIRELVNNQSQTITLANNDQSAISHLAFRKDDKWLISGIDGQAVKLWDVVKQDRFNIIGRKKSDLLSIGTDPEGARVATGYKDGEISVWETLTGKQIGDSLIQKDDPVMGVTFSPVDPHLLVSAHHSGAVILWDLHTHERRGELPGHQGAFSDLVFSPDGRVLATASWDNSIILWDVKNRQRVGSPLKGQGTYISSIAFNSQAPGLLTSGDGDGAITLWDLRTSPPKVFRRLFAHQHAVTSVAFSPDGKTLASASDHENTIIFWKWDDPFLYRLAEKVYNGHNKVPLDLSFSHNGKYLATASIEEGIILDSNSFKKIAPSLKHSDGKMLNIDFDPSGQLLASSNDKGEIILWDANTFRPKGSSLQTQKEISRMAFSPDGNILATAHGDQTLLLWDVATRKPLGDAVPVHTKMITSLAFSHSGKMLAAGSWDESIGRMIVWNIDDPNMPQEVMNKQHDGGIRDVEFSPNDSIVAAAGMDEKVTFWDIRTHNQKGAPISGAGTDGGVLSLAISPDGMILATGNEHQKVRWWHTWTKQPISAPLTIHGGGITKVVFSPDGHFLASAGRDKSIILWDLSLESWIKQACAIANRNLTFEEWRKYVGESEYQKTCPDIPVSG